MSQNYPKSYGGMVHWVKSLGLPSKMMFQFWGGLRLKVAHTLIHTTKMWTYSQNHSKIYFFHISLTFNDFKTNFFKGTSKHTCSQDNKTPFNWLNIWWQKLGEGKTLHLAVEAGEKNCFVISKRKIKFNICHQIPKMWWENVGGKISFRGICWIQIGISQDWFLHNQSLIMVILKRRRNYKAKLNYCLIMQDSNGIYKQLTRRNNNRLTTLIMGPELYTPVQRS